MGQVVVISLKEASYPKDRLATWFPNLPVLHTLGNLDLLRLPLTALFCSRKCPGDAILKAYELACKLREKEIPVIGGFHTPVEKDMLEILLKGKWPVMICLARGLQGMRIPVSLRKPIAENRVLLISSQVGQEKRGTKETAEERNRLVAALATDWIFIHVEPGGRLDTLFQSFDRQS